MLRLQTGFLGQPCGCDHRGVRHPGPGRTPGESSGLQCIVVCLLPTIVLTCSLLPQPSDTITAWSLLVSIMFSAVRDGYYQAMRAQRISQRHRNVHQRETAAATSSLGMAENSGNANQRHTGVEKSASASEVVRYGTAEKKWSTGGGGNIKPTNEMNTTTVEAGGGGGGNDARETK